MEFNDVYGLEEELLEMVPKPVLAVLFLFPYSSDSDSEVTLCCDSLFLLRILFSNVGFGLLVGPGGSREGSRSKADPSR